jgi:phosphohistidine phosphatase
LSDHGRTEVEKIARAVAARKIAVAEILHSDKLRAKETAGILASFVAPRAGLREIGGLSPNDDPWLAKGEIEAASEPVMLVGHLPHLGRLASLLVNGDPERQVVDFQPAAVVCLSRAGDAWEVRWTLTPAEA